MKNQVIYQGALALIGEPQDGEGTEDYAERAPYILANFISENAALDRQYRAAHGTGGPGTYDCPACVDMNGEFPLSPRFATVAEVYLASLLIDSEDSARADAFFDRYCRSLTALISTIPAMREKIFDVFRGE